MRENGGRYHKGGIKIRGKSNGHVCYLNYDDGFKDVSKPIKFYTINICRLSIIFQ